MKVQQVWVILDTKGQGRVVGVFDHEAQAAEIQAVSPAYYRTFALPMNAVNPDSVRWVQDEHGRQTLQRLSSQMLAIPDDAAAASAGQSGRAALAATGLGLAWQVVVVALAFQYGPMMGTLEAELGISLSFVSDAYWDTYRLWPILPLACSVPVAVGFIRHKRHPSTGAVVCALGGAAFLTCWTLEAVLAPLRDVIAKVG